MIKVLIAVVILAVVAVFILNRPDNEDASESTAPVTTDTNGSTEPPSVTDEPESVETDEPVLGSSEVLDLSGQGLSQTPGYVFERTGIKKLDVSNNNLSGSMQGEVRFLQNLTELNMSNNQFTGVPAEIGQLKNLEVLNLSNNQITGLPHELGNLSNLRVLNLQGNNYAQSDLEIIKSSLPATTEIIVD